MWIEICAEPGAPPSGAVRIDGGRWSPFHGWLALLCLLSGVLDAQPPPGVPAGLGGELTPGGDAELGQGM
jgi:hypothetical protein